MRCAAIELDAIDRWRRCRQQIVVGRDYVLRRDRTAGARNVGTMP